MIYQHKPGLGDIPGGTCRAQPTVSLWQDDTSSSLEQAAELTPLLTYVGEHADAALHGGLLAGHEPGAVVDPEDALQQLHEHGLPGLQGKHSSVTASAQQGSLPPARLALASPSQLGCSACWAAPRGGRASTTASAAAWEGWEPLLEGKMKQELLQQKALLIEA